MLSFSQHQRFSSIDFIYLIYKQVSFVQLKTIFTEIGKYQSLINRPDQAPRTAAFGHYLQCPVMDSGIAESMVTVVLSYRSHALALHNHRVFRNSSNESGAWQRRMVATKKWGLVLQCRIAEVQKITKSGGSRITNLVIFYIMFAIRDLTLCFFSAS